MFRVLGLESPLEAGSWDNLSIYYYYQTFVRESQIAASNDPMITFRAPQDVGITRISETNLEVVDWSLGGFSGLSPLQPQQTDFNEWVGAYTNYQYGGRREKYAGVVREDPRLSVNLPRFFEQQKELTYRKILTNSAIQAFLNSRHVMGSSLDRRADRTFNLDQHAGAVNGLVRNFLFTTMAKAESIGESLGISANEILGLEEGSVRSLISFPGTATLLDVVSPMIDAMKDARDDNDPRTLVGQALFSGLLDFPLSLEEILELVMSSPEYQNPTIPLQFSYHRTQQITPFVSTAKSREYLSETANTVKRASVQPKYNFYIPSYETSTSAPGVQETYIPNGYAYYILQNSVADTETPNQTMPREAEENLRVAGSYPGTNPDLNVEGRIRESGQNASSTAISTITLDQTIPQQTVRLPRTPEYNIEQPRSQQQIDAIANYYRRYSEALADTTSESPQITETIIFPASDRQLLDTVKRSQHIFPYSVGLEFWRDSFENRSAEIIYENLRSVGLSAGISGSAPTATPQRVTTEKLRSVDLMGTQVNTKSRAPVRNQAINEYSLSNVLNFSAPPENTVVKPLVLTQNCLEGATGLKAHPFLIPNDDEVVNQLTEYANDVSKSYQEILEMVTSNTSWQPPNRTVSEAVGYKITKRKLSRTEEGDYAPGSVIQTIYIGNTPALNDGGESQQSTYVDTQIKYGEEYSYSLYEYRLVYSTEYEFFTIAQNTPAGLEGNTSDTIRASFNNLTANQIPVVNYRCYVLRRPKIQLLEVPIYDNSFYTNPEEAGNWMGSSFGLSYPPVRVMDTPPPPPDLDILPLKGNMRQIKIRMTPSAGSYKGQHALPVVYVPQGGRYYEGLTPPIDILRYQQEFAMPPPQPQDVEGEPAKVLALNYESNGITEIKAIKLYRTTEMNSMAPSLARAYKSFDSVENPASAAEITLVNTLYAPDADPDPDRGEMGVVSYNMVDTIQPNQFYYYTCVAVDAHNNPSPPSLIYQVRLVFDKGLLIPEVEVYEHKPPSSTVSTRRFARFIQVQPAPIQSNPFSERNEEGQITSIRNLASERGQTSITNNRFIVRMTSKDTGRKFDVELKFNYQDTPIQDEEE